MRDDLSENEFGLAAGPSAPCRAPSWAWRAPCALLRRQSELSESRSKFVLLGLGQLDELDLGWSPTGAGDGLLDLLAQLVRGGVPGGRLRDNHLGAGPCGSTERRSPSSPRL